MPQKRKISTKKNIDRFKKPSVVILSKKNKQKKENSDLIKRGERILSLAKEEGMSIHGLVIHDNLDTLATIDSKHYLRVQEIFLIADERVLKSLFRICTRRAKKQDNEIVNSFIINNPPGRMLDKIPKTLLRNCYGPKGKHYNLQDILNEIMNKYTGYIPGIYITWRKASKGKTHITWATYREIGQGGIIKVNKILDSPTVPKYVIESVVYHELLHFVVPTEVRNGEYNMHTEKFKELLSKFPNQEKALKWQKEYLLRHS